MPHKQFLQGETVDLVFTLTDTTTNTGAEADGAPSITITNPEGTVVVSNANMTEEVTGRWVYFYTPANDAVPGLYKAVAVADTDLSGAVRDEKDVVRFEVVEA